jgi:hypothetical protein
MFLDFRIKDCAAERFEALERAFLVGAHEPAITDHIGRKNRCKLPFDRLLLDHGLPSQSLAVHDLTIIVYQKPCSRGIGSARVRPSGSPYPPDTARPEAHS